MYARQRSVPLKDKFNVTNQGPQKSASDRNSAYVHHIENQLEKASTNYSSFDRKIEEVNEQLSGLQEKMVSVARMCKVTQKFTEQQEEQHRKQQEGIDVLRRELQGRLIKLEENDPNKDASLQARLDEQFEEHFHQKFERSFESKFAASFDSKFDARFDAKFLSKFDATFDAKFDAKLDLKYDARIAAMLDDKLGERGGCGSLQTLELLYAKVDEKLEAELAPKMETIHSTQDLLRQEVKASGEQVEQCRATMAQLEDLHQSLRKEFNTLTAHAQQFNSSLQTMQKELEEDAKARTYLNKGNAPAGLCREDHAMHPAPEEYATHHHATQAPGSTRPGGESLTGNLQSSLEDKVVPLSSARHTHPQQQQQQLAMQMQRGS
ncbi:hypothetical protein CYMTET_33068, partial [Cymbomonas tetramitiformis]